MSRTERRWDAPRLLLAGGVLAAVAAIATWNLGSHSGASSNGRPGTCQLPTSATRGTEPLPAFVNRLATPMGPPAVTFTKTEAGATVYGYCYDIVDGANVSAATDLLNGHGYVSTPGQDPRTQLSFRKRGGHPYGVSITVTGGLQLPNPAGTAKGGVSLVWTNVNPDS